MPAGVKLVVVETISNPLIRVADLARISAHAKKAGAKPEGKIVGADEVVADARGNPLLRYLARKRVPLGFVTAVVTAVPSESLADAARRMTEHGASHLVVLDVVGQRPLGVLSTLDLARVLGRRPGGAVSSP